MSRSAAIDWHAHVLIEGLPQVDDPLWPRLIQRRGGIEMRVGINGGLVLPAGAVDVGVREAWMEAQGISQMILSPFPALVADRLETPAAAEIAALTNDALAAQVATADGRYLGLGTLPFRAGYGGWQDEMYRLRNDLELLGVEVLSTTIIEAAQAGWLPDLLRLLVEWDCWMFVHPELPLHRHEDTVYGHPVESMGLDAPMDLARAGLALATQGRDDQKVVLAHGGGALAWLLSRMDHYARQAGVSDNELPGVLARRRLHVDDLTFGTDHRAFLTSVFGPDRVVRGSNYPTGPFPNADEHH